jgi:GNAT superfamily N-acetyltransferase
VDIRAAQPEDALPVARVHVRAWQVAYRELMDAEFLAALRPEERAADYDFGSNDPTAPQTFLAVEGETIHGFATIGSSRDGDAPGLGEIYALYVDPDSWRGGVGGLLLIESRERMRRHGYEEAILWVLIGNEDAQRFYRADGWLRDGAERVEEPYGVVSTVVRYRRELGPRR